MSTGFNFITKNNSPYVLNLYIDGSNNNCLDTEFINPNPYLGQTFTITPTPLSPPSCSAKTGMAATEDRGCSRPDPHLSSTTRRSLAPMKDQFRCEWRAYACDGYQVDYGSQLTQAGAGADATWTITVFG